MSRNARSRRRPGRPDTGSSWISYSDMMAAMMLVFVLVLCYSLYQYFLMLETKTQELDEKQTLLVSQQALLENQTAQLVRQQSDLESQEAQLLSAQASLQDQQALLDRQQEQLDIAQSALAARENELSALQLQLADQQTKLEAATSLLNTQKDTLDAQQTKIDDLIGMRTRIIQDLSSTLQSASLRATVDTNTGDIVLDSAVFFDTASSTIKESGKQLLDKFVPIYLSVLLQPAYEDYLGEIIIEGHTDTQGEYLMNLELSQQRALTVAKYCLQMPGLTSQQREYLRSILTAKGKSYSDPIYNADGSINMDASRRVEFKFSLKDAEMIAEMNRILSAQ